MKTAQLATLRFISLLFLLPGLAGMVISTMVSMHYMDTLPKSPAPEELRTTPRNINGYVVFQTAEEDQRLTFLEYTSVGAFAIGLGLGLLLSLGLTHLLASLLYGVSPTDATVFLAVPALVLAIALLAAWLPARHAARIDPAVTLRAE